MFCPKCGKQNEDNARFCCGCGVVFEDITNPANPPQYNIPFMPQQFNQIPQQPPFQQNTQPIQFRPQINQQPQYIPPMMYQPQMYRQPPVPGYGLSIASMVLGIVSLVLFLVFYISLPCAIVGIVLGCIALSKAKSIGQNNGFAIAGIICSSVAIVLVILMLILVAINFDDMNVYM